ncbi:hypothetical protein FT643_14885 [Ketobacter sp. MCCC 1A13808]|uniref:hypothetical protein n=1 Tax=Ketobacter sp. MCCC 1A13808 TaxID=2602738 RepID=UPI000F2200D6|nr:hypothetical protein [Ketobacter sp. MCCC 1A13808]MVF13425.1 hypothetical protein [Ketobacter sp. MCCC 1A13808]RLP52944.1 MAG: hypothetical protein D6160_18200 [Ketobacter sp.]
MGIKNWVSVMTAATLAVSITGCSVRDMAASGMVSFGNKYMSPWFMASNDTDIMCAMGEGMAAMTYPMGPNIDPMIPMVTLASGMCADEKAKQEELRFLRAMHKDDVTTAQDARTMQKRWTALSAERQYFGYQAAVRYFGEPGKECPDFADDNEEMAYLFGMFGALQAVQMDLAVGGVAGVPLDVMPKALEGLKCVNSDKFWGLPDAILAVVDISKSNLDGDEDAVKLGKARLQKAARAGEEEGVRMVHLVEAAMYVTQGDEAAVKEVIRKHVEMIEETPPNPDLNLLDKMTTRGLRLISDKLWTAHTGQRTPFGKFGTFWDDQVISDDSMDIEDLL